MSSDILGSFQQLQQWTSELHWFCPRDVSTDPDGFYFAEDLIDQQEDDSTGARAERGTKCEEARHRTQLVFKALQLFAFDGADATNYQLWLEEQLALQMQRCDICIREFHRGRRTFKEELTDTYDEEAVVTFMERFDGLNVRRIEKGLDQATRELASLPKEKRKAAVLKPVALYALFESLTCRAMYCNEARLKEHFDVPLGLVQTNKFLKLSSFVPAMTHFLFSTEKRRQDWAEKSWEKAKRSISAIEFEGSVKEPLTHAMARVQLHDLQKAFLGQFWSGVRAIVQRLDKELITHSLRAITHPYLDTDICSLAFNHLQIDDDGFRPMLATIGHILRTSPNDLWEAMGTRPPIAWIEQFFNSPALARILKTAKSEVFEEVFGWITPFLSSIKPVNQPAVAGAFVNKLLGSFQDETKYDPAVATHCLHLGLTILSETFRALNGEQSSTTATSEELFEVMIRHVSRISQLARKTSSLTAPASEVFRQAITFDCSSVRNHAKLLTQDKTTQEQCPAFHATIWSSATTSLDTNNMVLTQNLFLAIRSLASIEPFVVKKGALSTSKEHFNKALPTYNTAVKDILDRINDFDPADLETLFDTVDSANATVMLLFSSDNDVRTGAAELMKTLSQQASRREAVDSIIRDHFTTVTNAFSYSFSLIAHSKAFVPAQTTLKLCADILDALCNSESGVLRSQTVTPADARSIERFWQALWSLLIMIFQTTEVWSEGGHSKDRLMDFCRDVMEFAEKAFDQFGVIKGALDQAQLVDLTAEVSPAGQRLVKAPRSATKVMVKWLKLRDEFLVARSCGLVCKLLVRLKDTDTMLDDEPLGMIFEIVSGTSRSTLSASQKAELRRALETHVGESLEPPEEKPGESSLKVVKKEVIDLDKWKLNARNAPELTLDSTIAHASPTYEKFKAMRALKDQAKASSKLPTKPAVASTPKRLDSSAEFIRRRKEAEEELKKRNAALIAARRKKASGEGSGVSTLGIVGKDHSEPKGTGMMVSSDEESSEESETELDKELFGPARKEKTSALTDEQARAMKQARGGPVKKTRIVRSAKDMRARLAPDLAPLHKDLLAWEYFHDGPFPPGSTARDYAEVMNSFRDAYEYQHTFKRLLTLEAWSGFVKEKEENTSQPFEVKILNRSSVDSFIEVSTSMSMTRSDRKDGRMEIGDGDLVLLSKSSTPASSESSPHCMAKVSKITYKKANVEVLYRVLPGNAIVQSLAPGVQIWGVKVMSITPLEREYGGLSGLQYYDLCDEIARAKPSPLLKYSDDRLAPLERNYSVNKTQAKAIKSALDNDAFTLIQGPPGTGKTKTIVAIVGALLSDTLKNRNLVIKPAQAVEAGLAKKMLICAPSNAAVDELVMRFKDGVKTLSGDQQKVNVVRIGRGDAINANVQDVTLEELINRKLNLNTKTNADGASKADTQKIFDEHKQISDQLKEVRQRMDEADANGGVGKPLKEEFDSLRRKKTLLGEKIDSAKDNEQNQSRQADLRRRKAMQEVINEAHVICATLSGSGHDMFRTLDVEFETVIIDEAAQCVELSALIPLKYGCAKCILVGDPQQLPPTVFSRDAARFKYEQSLFVRMQTNHPKDVHLLDTQYRMHPEISLFPSKAFYEGRLLDGTGMAALRARPWHGTALLSPYRFFDVQGQHSAAPTGHSLVNHAEVRTALQLYDRLTSDFRNYDFRGKIGIITPYKSQLRELKVQFNRHLGEDTASGIEFNTTDAFQGREAEIIIFSCVRASPAGGIGFLNDIRRMNVGLTRAKCSLWVLGNSQSLMKGEFWSKLVEESRARDRYITGDIENMLRVPSKIVHTIEDGTSKDPSSKQVASGPASIDVKMGGTESDFRNNEIKRRESVKQEMKQESKPVVKSEVKEETRVAIKAERGIKVEPSRGSSLIPPLRRPIDANTKYPMELTKMAADPGASLKRKLSPTPVGMSRKVLKGSRSSSVIDSDTEMRDVNDSAPPSRPSSSNSNATNGSLRPSDTGTNGQSKPPQAQRPTAPRKKVDPFIRKKR